MLAVVVSRADRASEHIGERLLELADWGTHEDTTRPDADGGGTYYRTDGVELRTFEDLHIYAEGLAEPFDDPDLLFVASRHSGETGPLLTAHPTGNPGEAEFGGADESFARAAPNALSALLSAFDEHAPEEYGVGMECTHHGPTDLDVPSLFVELGSGDEEWDDPAGASAVARAILDCRGVAPDRERQFVGFGGGHYAPRFERVVRETDWAVGHVLADWSLDDMRHPREASGVLHRAFGRSGAEHALVDGDYRILRETVEELGYRVVDETWLRESTGVPLATVHALEDAITPIDDGLRFGTPARGYEGAFEVATLPTGLAEEAANVDIDAARGAIEQVALAFETEEGGARPVGRIALPEGTDFEAVIRGLATVLELKYDTVSVEDEHVVASERAFVPEKARTLGVDDGPVFGRLAAGESVEVEGRTIEPGAVHEERQVTFPRRTTR